MPKIQQKKKSRTCKTLIMVLRMRIFPTVDILGSFVHLFCEEISRYILCEMRVWHLLHRNMLELVVYYGAVVTCISSKQKADQIEALSGK